MNDKFSLVYEQIHLDNLEQQLMSGYLTESKILEMVSSPDISDTELNLIERYKPGYLVSLLEANPVGMLSRLGTWAKSKVPLQNFQASAQGQQQYNQQANTLKRELHKYLGTINKKISSITNREFMDFLQSQGIDISKVPNLRNLLKNPKNIPGDAEINKAILDAVTFSNTVKSSAPKSASASASSSQSLPRTRVLKIAAVLNNVLKTSRWDWATTEGLIKQLRAAGINIS